MEGSVRRVHPVRIQAPIKITNNPRIRLPSTPQRDTKNLAKRVVIIMTIATVAKIALNTIWERPRRSIKTRGEVEKKTKNAPIAVLKPSV
jgi:hypothetical protein